MRRPRWRPVAGALAVAVALLASACGPADDGAADDVLAPLERGDASLEWRGMQPCADCDGIDTRLLLARDGARRGFVLVERYLAQPPVRFVSRGGWDRRGDLLRLEPEEGGSLAYAVLDDGRLQPRDSRGRRLPGSDGDGVLAPVGGGGVR